MPAQRVTIIANSRAAADPALRDAVGRLRGQGVAIRVAIPWESGETRRLTEDAIRAGTRVVVAAGGDGTLNEVVDGVMALQAASAVSVGIIPYGTANDFAKTCGVPLNGPLNALRMALATPPRRLDVGRINGRHFINAATGGVPAKATSGAQGRLKNAVGRMAYVLTGLRNLSRLRGSSATLTWRGGEWSGRMFGLAVGNGRQAGGGVVFAPKAVMDDGLLDVVVLPEQPIQGLLTLARDLATWGRPRNPANAVVFRTDRLRLRAAGGFQLNLDGEPIQDRDFAIDVLGGAIGLRVSRPPLARPPR